MLQEASRDEFCSFIISSPITHSEVNSALGLFGKACCAFRPFGFSIIPDGSRGLQSDASLVTIALPQVLDADRESDEVIEIMSNLVSRIVGAIKEAGRFLLYPVKLSVQIGSYIVKCKFSTNRLVGIGNVLNSKFQL